jgi:hypothetical protein
MDNYVEMRAENMDNGRMLELLNNAILDAVTQVIKNHLKYGRENGHLAAAKVTLNINLMKSKASTSDVYFEHEYGVQITAPKIPKRAAYFRHQDGKILVESPNAPRNADQKSFIEPGDGMKLE